MGRFFWAPKTYVSLVPTCKVKYFAGKRPPVEEIYKYLDRNRKWIVQKLFSGADIELIAHALAGETYAIFINLVSK